MCGPVSVGVLTLHAGSAALCTLDCSPIAPPPAHTPTHTERERKANHTHIHTFGEHLTFRIHFRKLNLIFTHALT